MKVAAAVAILGTVLLSCSHARTIRRPLSAQQFDQPVVVNLAELKPTVASVWVPSITTSPQSLQVPVSGLPGTPLKQNDMSRLIYTVTYQRRPAYVLRGTINVSPHPVFASLSSNGEDTPEIPIQTPTITLSQNSQRSTVPASKVKCTGLMVTGARAVTCSFNANIFADTLPPAGNAQVTLSLPGSGTHVQTSAAPYDFASVLPPNTRFSSTDQSAEILLSAAGNSPSSAIVTNYFENGNGLVLPTGISGTQPAANSILKDTQTFTYTALFGDMPRELCGRKLKVTSTATIQSTSDGVQQPETFTNSVDLVLLGCNSSSFQSQPNQQQGSTGPNCNTPTPPSIPTRPAPPPATATAADGRVAPPGEASHQQHKTGLYLQSELGNTGLKAAVESAVRAVNPFVQAERRRRLAQDGRFMPQGVFMAATGSKLCGRSVCSAEQECIDNIMCCSAGASRCGNTCCGAGNVCMLGSVCMPAGSSTCGASACSPQQQCLGGKCCDASKPPCGASCCDGAAGEVCVLGQCVSQGSSACGSRVCGPNQACVAPGVCCGAGETACGASCCNGQCLNGQCVAPGSSICAGSVCGPGTTCAGGAVCCPVGASFCGGQCCGSGNTCAQNRCVPYGSTPCGANVCGPDQTCQNGICCQRGETGCGNGCCNTAAGMQCLRGQCVPWGTQPCGTTTCPMHTRCGDPMRNLCCPIGTISCAGNCCGRDQVCSWRLQQCVAANSEAARETAGGGHVGQPVLQQYYGDYGSMPYGGYPMPSKR